MTTTDDPADGCESTAPSESAAQLETRGAAASAGTSGTVLEATDVRVEFGHVTVLEDVSTSLEAGAVTALIGPNGAGKTTLLRTLAGLVEPTEGAVTYHGPTRDREIGYLPQQPAFRPGFTVLETLSFYASLVGAGREEAETRLDRVGLADAAHRRVQALSGGMTRLVGIAQATIGEPPVVVLDEPASGLDPGMRAHVFDVMADLADAGAAVLTSSHDLALVERTADRLVLLDGGTIVDGGEPSTLLDRHEVDSVRGVFESAIGGDRRQVRVRGESA